MSVHISRVQIRLNAIEFSCSDPTKYFGCELGAQTNYDARNERYIVNGEHDAAKLQDILDGFIKKFVLCPACDNPETALVGHFSVTFVRSSGSICLNRSPTIDRARCLVGSAQPDSQQVQGMRSRVYYRQSSQVVDIHSEKPSEGGN